MHCSGMRMRAGIALLLLALAACGEKKPAAGGTTASVEDKTAEEIARFQAEENARSQMTMVDAASGEAAAMPADWTGPTAFDLQPKGNEARAATAEKPKTTASTTLPSSDQPVAQEDFPSVAN